MRRRLIVAAGSVALLLVSLYLLDRAFPPALPAGDADFARLVVDRHGEPLRAFADRRGVWRYPVSPDQVSPWYLDALLGYEDRWFYWHPGVNPVALLRAAWQNLRSGRVVSGGSTLTMQVARLLHPHPRTLAGKLGQMVRALQLEWRLSKAEILQLYLERAPFGGTVEGIAAASHAYLAKSPRDLTRAEAALLAVLPQAPSRLRPDRHPERARVARDKVLSRLARQGIWSAEAVAEARREPVAGYGLRQPMRAPLLARRLARAHPDRPVIRTTLDSALQARIRGIVRRYLRRLPARSSAAVLVVENASGAVRAYLGSADFFDAARYGQVDMVRARRSPGSTLKPLLYGLALDAGLIHSESLLIDAPRRGATYRPANFERGFSGPVSVRTALQQSLNVPAVNLLAHYGPHRFVARLKNAGIDLRLPAGGTPNLAVILGGVGASLEQLVTAYTAFANAGRVRPLRLLADAPPAPPRRLMSPGAAWIVGELLRQSPAPGRLHGNLTRQRRDIAWKTGTSFGYRDSWAIGSSADWTIGVWVGRPDGTPMPGHWGGRTAAPLLFQLFQSLPEGTRRSIGRPDSVTRVAICWPLGTVAAGQPEAWCHRRRLAWVLDGQVPPTLPAPGAAYRQNPVTYWIDPRSGLRVDARCGVDGAERRQAALWPAAVEPWVPRAQRAAALLPPPDPACGIGPDDLAPLRIAGVESGARLRAARVGRLPAVDLKVEGGSGRIEWYVDGVRRQAADAATVFSHRFMRPGRHQIVAIDAAGRIDRVEVEVLANRVE